MLLCQRDLNKMEIEETQKSLGVITEKKGLAHS